MSASFLFDSYAVFGLAAFCAFLVGLSKTGVPGLSLIFSTLMAAVLPAKEAVALVLLLLITGDLFALRFYRQHADWPTMKRLMPAVAPGLLLGTWLLNAVSAAQIRPVLAFMVFGLLLIELVRMTGLLSRLHRHPAFALAVGSGVGVATVVGNAAGPLMALFLILNGLDKRQFMGTSAWFFFVVNVLKVPLLLYIGLMQPQVWFSALPLLPFVVVGALLGRRALDLLPQRVFVVLVLAGAFSSALYLLASA